jgi:hypothetical protein
MQHHQNYRHHHHQQQLNNQCYNFAKMLETKQFRCNTPLLQGQYSIVAYQQRENRGAVL